MKSLLIAAALTVFSAGDTEAVLCLANTAQQQPACCKANKGVCGCRAGKIVCCDKTFADGCTCNSEEPSV